MTILRVMLTDGVIYEGDFDSDSQALTVSRDLKRGFYADFPLWRVRLDPGPQDPFHGPPISINGIYVQIITVV